MTKKPFHNETTQAERRAALEQGSTLHQFQQSDAATSHGRYDAHEKTTVVGATPVPVYPAGPDWTAVDPCGQEPPLNYCVDQMEPVGTAAEIEASIAKLTASPLEPLSAQGNCGGADEAPASGGSLPDAVEAAAPPTSTEVED